MLIDVQSRARWKEKERKVKENVLSNYSCACSIDATTFPRLKLSALAYTVPDRSGTV